MLLAPKSKDFFVESSYSTSSLCPNGGNLRNVSIVVILLVEAMDRIRYFVPGQHCKRKLDGFQTSNTFRKIAISPKDRFERNKNFVKDLEAMSREFSNEFDKKLGTTPLEVSRFWRALPTSDQMG